jgi:hypothetical protein
MPIHDEDALSDFGRCERLEQLLQTGDHIGVAPIAIAKQDQAWGNSLAVITAESFGSWAVWDSGIISGLGGKRVDRPRRRINPRPLVRLEEGRG